MQNRTAELQQSREQYASLVENTPDVITRWNRDLKLIFANNAFVGKTGVSLEELYGKNNLEMGQPQHIAVPYMNSLRKAFETGIPVEHFNSFDTPHGEVFYYSRIVPEKDETGEVVTVLGIARDITELKKAQRQVEEQAHYIHRIASTVPDMISITNLESRKFEYLNTATFKAQGFDPEEMNSKSREELDEYVHVDDRPLLATYFQKLASASDEDIVTAEYRARDNHGLWKWFLVRGRVFQRNEKGKAVQVLNVIENITERKKSEAEINRLRDEIAQRTTDKYYTLFNSIDEGFCIIEMLYDDTATAVDYRFIEANRAFEAQTGLKNIIGKTGKELTPGTRVYGLEQYNSTVRTGEPARFEIYHQPTSRWYQAYTSPVGSVDSAHVAVLLTDITERKQREQEQEYLLRLSDALRPLSNAAEIEDCSCRLLGEHLNASRVYFPVINEKQGYARVERQYLRDRETSVAGMYSVSAYSWTLPFLRRGEPLVVNNIYESNIIQKHDLAAMEIIQDISVVTAPLVKKGELVGALTVADSRPRVWHPLEVELVRETLELTWAIVERARVDEAVRINEERNRWLKETYQSVVNGASLQDSLHILSKLAIRELANEVRTAFYLVDNEGIALNTIRGAGNMPNEYADEVDGFLIGLNSLACGLAVPTGKPVLTPDVWEEPLWQPWLHIAKKYDYRGCWSFPIKTRENQAVGAFALYFRQPRHTTAADLELADIIARAAAVIITNNSESQQRNKAEEALLRSQEQLARELADAKLLQQISNRIIEENNINALYAAILDSAIEVMNADFASIQSLVPEETKLFLMAEKNFDRKSAELLEYVNTDSTTIFGTAQATGERTIVSDIQNSSLKTDEAESAAYHLSEIASMQSTPLVSRNGNCIGMISTYWKESHLPSERELNFFDVLARQTADLIERKKAEEALRESEERLRITMESAVDFAIVTTDTKGIIDGWNNGAERIFEYKADEVIGRSAELLFTEQDRVAGVPEREMALAREVGVAADERWHRRKNGTSFFVSGVMRPIYNPGLIGYVKIGRDITEQKLLEQQKDEFIGIASHELRTPVTSIKLYSELLKEILPENGNPDKLNIVSKLDTQVDRLTQLIHSLLDTTRMAEGQLALNISEFDINALIQGCIDEMQHTTGVHRILFSNNNQINITADKERIGQALINIITNAIKYSPKGGDIIVATQALEEGIQVSVQDNGIGIPADIKDEIFGRFYRVRSAQVDTYPGMGLGLYITANIIERHGGRIWVDSRLHEGTTVHFLLPF